MIAAFSCSLSKKKCFSSDLIFTFFRFERKIKKIHSSKIQSRNFFEKLLSELSPAAPAATLTAPERPSLPPVGSAVASAHIAVQRPTSPLVVVLGAGSAPPLGQRELAREPEQRRRRDGSGRRRRRLPSRRDFFLGRRSGQHDGFQPRSLVCRLALLPSPGQVRHQFPGGDPTGVGRQMDSVASPDARSIHSCQVLRRGLAGTEETKDI
jgi:hypothetical protein